MFTIDEAPVTTMKLSPKTESCEVDIGFHLIGMGDHGVLQLVFCVVEWSGTTEIHTAAIRIDSISHGGAYRGVDFNAQTSLEVGDRIESSADDSTPSSQIEVDEELAVYREKPTYEYTPPEELVPITAAGSLSASLTIHDTKEQLRGSQMV